MQTEWQSENVYVRAYMRVVFVPHVPYVPYVQSVCNKMKISKKKNICIFRWDRDNNNEENHGKHIYLQLKLCNDVTM